MSYRNTLQADALKLVAKKMQSSLAVEGELPEDGLAAYGDDGDDMMMALARRIVSGDEEDEAETMEEVFAQARNAESEAEELLVDDGWKVVEDRAGDHLGQRQRTPRQREWQRPPRPLRHRADRGACPGQRSPRQRERAHARHGQRERGPTATTRTSPRRRSSRCSPGPSSWPKSRSSPGAARPRLRHCPCSSGRWNRSGRKSRSARDARPQWTRERSSPVERRPPPQ